MWAPIAAVLMAVGTFSTPGAIESEQEWLAQQRAADVEQFQCAEVDVKTGESGRSGAC
ncbi:MAG: hypothetical protein PVF91_03725 [Chromatiales bacterium]